MSSYKLGYNTDDLKDFAQNVDNKMVLIPNALDVFPDGARKDATIQGLVNYLQEIGFVVDVVSLKDYFGKSQELNEDLKNYKAFFVAGGNCFVLRQAMQLSGFDKFVLNNKNNDNFLYSGYSAGMCVLAPNMKGLEIVDDINLNPYNTKTIYEGLGLVDYVPVPHYRSNHHETSLVDVVVEYYTKNNIKHKALQDGEAIVKNTKTNEEKFYKLANLEQKL